MQHLHPFIIVTPPPRPPHSLRKLALISALIVSPASVIFFCLSCCVSVSYTLPLGFAFIVLGFIIFFLLYWFTRP
jgi:hypothetical protein